MTRSHAETLFRTATPITPADLTMHHLDMLQAVDIDVDLRMQDLPAAGDAIVDGDHDSMAVVRCVEAYNARCGRRA